MFKFASRVSVLILLSPSSCQLPTLAAAGVAALYASLYFLYPIVLDPFLVVMVLIIKTLHE